MCTYRSQVIESIFGSGILASRFVPLEYFHFAMSAQTALKDLWLAGNEGHLSAREQLKAWALREAWREVNDGKYGMNSWIAERVAKVGGGAPTNQSVKELLAKIDEDEDWFPGKQYGAKRGRKRVLTGAKALAIVNCAMAKRKKGGDPTYGHICGNCPDAVKNPETGKPVDKRAVYTVFKERCYDDEEHPENTWSNKPRLCRTALPAEMRLRRYNWAVWMLSLRHTAKWYFENLVWTDICNSVLPRTEKKAEEQALARKSGKVWVSEGCQQNDNNLRGDKRALKTNSWDTVRVWWAPVLTRGKLHVEILPENFAGDHIDGAAPLVSKVRAALNIRFQNTRAPRVVFVDRGCGFFNAGSGAITSEFKQALKEHSLVAFMGDDAARQPGSLQEMMLHETAVAWIRRGLTWTLPPKPWEETVADYTIRLKQVVRRINEEYNVEGLCQQLPERIQKLYEAEGGRLSK